MTAPVHLSGAVATARLGRHHFAHLRAVAQGMRVTDAAQRYLDLQDKNEAGAAHRLIVERARALARRRADPRWRLIGLEIRPGEDRDASMSLEAWAQSQGLSDWPQAELIELYAESGGRGGPERWRREQRNGRLRTQQLELLRELEVIAADKPAPADLLDGWYAPTLAQRFQAVGLFTLADLQHRVAQGGRWWRGLKGIGPHKARTISSFLRFLLGGTAPAGPGGWVAPAVSIDERQALDGWLAARTASPRTATQYRREAERFLWWCRLVRGVSVLDVRSEDCAAYLSFLEDPPAAWKSRRNAARETPGWAPFKGPLSEASRQLSATVLGAWFGHLRQWARVAENPWAGLSKAPTSAAGKGRGPGARVVSPALWDALLRHLDGPVATASMLRMRWICVFVRATGLTATELLRARTTDLKRSGDGWQLEVQGREGRTRRLALPAAVIESTRAYLRDRGFEDGLAADLPLLASLRNPASPIGYSALQQAFAGFARRALSGCDLSTPDAERLRRASAHWLRHTFAVESALRQPVRRVLQEQLGHRDPRMVATYFRQEVTGRRLGRA